MSEQQYQGTLASGGTFVADSQGIRILDPAGNQLASFDRAVISGISRDGQVVTVERHNDTIVTLTTASITDAVGLEQFVRDTIVTPPAPPPITQAPPAPVPPPSTQREPEPPPPLAFDAFDDDSPPEEPPAPPPPAAPRPPIISRPEAEDGQAEPARAPHDLPEPVPTTPPASTYEPLQPTSPPAADEEAERIPVAPLPPSQTPPASYEPTVPPPAAPPPVEAEVGEEKRGRRLWLWGCLGCGGLLILGIICIAVVVATGDIDWDEITGDDETPTPFIIVVTPEGSGPSGTEPEAGGSTALPVSDGVLAIGEPGVLEGLQVTLLSARRDGGGEDSEDVILNFQIENTTDEAKQISTILLFDLVDAEGNATDLNLFANIEGSLDVSVAPGETVTGEIGFEVPDGSGPFTAIFRDLLTDETLEWAVS